MIYEIFGYGVYIFIMLTMLHWSIVSVFTIVGYVGNVGYRIKRRKIDKIIAQQPDAENVEIGIVSIASWGVEDALKWCITHHVRMFEKYKINIIVDEGCDLEKDLKRLVNSYHSDRVRLVIVPQKFQTEAIAKGRAIAYFVRNCTEAKTWYAFIDDDNLILDKRFLKEISYFKGKKVIMNGILTPRPGRSVLAYVADWIRDGDDRTIFRFGTGLFGLPFNGLHGEALIADGETLRTVGFDRKSITEDYRFGIEAMKKGFRFSQSRTEVSILSPHSLTDFIRQRNRWFRGLWEDVRYAPLSVKIFTGIRLLDWRMGIIGSWAFLPLWFYMDVPLWLILFNSIGATYYYGTYVRGVLHLKGWRKRIVAFLAIPAYSVLETLGPHWRWSKKDEFTVIDKGKN